MGWITSSLTVACRNARKWPCNDCCSLWGEENDKAYHKLSPTAWGLRPCNTTGYCDPEQRAAGPSACAEGLQGFIASEALDLQMKVSPLSCTRNIHHLQQSWVGTVVTLILIYFGLWLINSLTASLSIGVFWYHGSFLLSHTPSLPSPSRSGLAFSQKSLVGPPFLQELLQGATRIIFALRPGDEKFFLKGMAFLFLLSHSF